METSKPATNTSPGGNGAVAQGIQQAGSGVHQAIEKVSQAARPAVDRLTSGAHEVVDKAKDVASNAAETIADKVDHLKEAKIHLVKACGSYVRANPVISLGIAVGAGVLLSRLLDEK